LNHRKSCDIFVYLYFRYFSDILNISKVDITLDSDKNIGYFIIRSLALQQIFMRLNFAKLNDNRLDEQDSISLVDGKRKK